MTAPYRREDRISRTQAATTKRVCARRSRYEARAACARLHIRRTRA